MLKKILYLGAAGIVLFAIVPAKLHHSDQQIAQTQSSVAAATISTADQVVTKDQPVLAKLSEKVELPELGAKSALAVDLKSGQVLYSHDPDQILSIASLTKLMTAMIVMDKTNKDAIVNVEADDLKVDCSCAGLVAGEQISIENLLKALLIPSGNDAAQTLARAVGGNYDSFVELMNQKAVRLNLQNTHFGNPVGLDSPDNYSTANDLLVLTKEFLKYSLLSQIVSIRSDKITSLDGKVAQELKTSNKLMDTDKDIVGVKTGYTTNAEGNLIVKDDKDGHEVLTIVLNTPNRELDTQKLLDWIYFSYTW